MFALSNGEQAGDLNLSATDARKFVVVFSVGDAGSVRLNGTNGESLIPGRSKPKGTTWDFSKGPERSERDQYPKPRTRRAPARLAVVQLWGAGLWHPGRF
jgi:hypothetical protein